MAVIYKATNKINGKAYIGFDSNWPSRKRIHEISAVTDNPNYQKFYFQKALVKHGVENFEWEIIKENATLEDEILMIEEHGTYETGYNLTKGGDGTLGWIPSTETRQKISNSNKGNKNCVGRKMSEETKQKISNANKGRKWTEEQKQNHSEILKGRILSPETRQKIVNTRKANGYTHSEETRQKLSIAHKNKTVTPKQLETLRMNAQKMKNVERTEETRQKISRAHKGRPKSPETIQKMMDTKSTRIYDYYQSQEYKDKMSKAVKGRKVSEETRQKISATKLKNKLAKQELSTEVISKNRILTGM